LLTSTTNAAAGSQPWLLAGYAYTIVFFCLHKISNVKPLVLIKTSQWIMLLLSCDLNIYTQPGINNALLLIKKISRLSKREGLT